MATKATVPAEKFFQCEVKRRRVREGGGYEPFWKMKTVADAVMDGDTEFRCPHCHNEVKLHRRAEGSTFISHVTHKLKGEGERCNAALNAPVPVADTEPVLVAA